MRFRYELQIDFNSKADVPPMDLKDGAPWGDDKYVFKSLYYGFRVEDEGYRNDSGFHMQMRTFKMEGYEELDTLKKMLLQLTNEIIDSDNVPESFQKALGQLNSLFGLQICQQIDENVEYEMSRWFGVYGVRVYLLAIPEKKAEIKPDLIITDKLYKAIVKYIVDGEKEVREVSASDIAVSKEAAAVKAASDAISALEKAKQLKVFDGDYKILSITIEEGEEVSLPIIFAKK